jgi:OOP family OmpA-OmpF porin
LASVLIFRSVKEKIMKSSTCLFGLIVALISPLSLAQDIPDKSGYLTDSAGKVVRNAYGDCWRTGYWTPAMAISECDPDLVKKEVALVPPQKELPILPEPAVTPAIVQLNAGTLFDFDRAEVNPAGKKLLDEKIVTGMKLRTDTGPLLITGHADRIGTEQYNQALSERRANAVKDYLVEQGVGVERLSVLAKGELEPDPAANTGINCRGMKGEKLIVCLQPDRRVTVESTAR